MVGSRTLAASSAISFALTSKDRLFEDQPNELGRGERRPYLRIVHHEFALMSGARRLPLRLSGPVAEEFDARDNAQRKTR
jgi:hypothetical protein